MNRERLKREPDALDNHPAFEGLRRFILGSPEPKEYIDFFSQIGADTSGILHPLYDLCEEVNAKTIVELGVRWGTTTVPFLVYCHYKGAHLYSVDIEDCHVAKSFMKALGLTDYWTFTQMNDIEYIESWKQRNDPKIDLLFIDSEHTYDLTIAELNGYSAFVSGLVILHDYYMEGVQKAIAEFLKSQKSWEYEIKGGVGVLKANPLYKEG